MVYTGSLPKYMALDTLTQIKKLIDSAKHILIILPHKAGGDHACAGLALSRILKTKHKKVDVVSDNFKSAQKLSFLTNEEIQTQLKAVHSLIVDIDVKHTPLDTLSYEVKDKTLSVSITPQTGAMKPENVKARVADFRYDLIITIGSHSIESLGKPARLCSNLFFEKPIINIDCYPGNEQFGQVNHIDMKSSSLCETIFSITEKLQERKVDKETATLLFAGILLATKSFRTQQVTPKLLTCASKLMDMGADREKLVNELFRTRTLTSLKLWGKTLSDLKHESNIGLVWSIIPREVFIQSDCTEVELDELVEEVVIHSPEAKIIVLFFEKPHEQTPHTHALVVTGNHFDARDLVGHFKGQKSFRLARLSFPEKPLNDTKKEVLSHIRTILEKHIQR